MNKIIIDNEFKKLIPPLTPDEFKQLEENIISEGIRDNLIIWNNILIDGHNRYEIAQKHGLEFQTMEKEFLDREDVKIWIIKNQFGRRNISAYDRSRLALQLEPLIAGKAKENLKTAGENFGKGCQKSDKAITSIDTKKELASLAGVSHDTIAKVKVIEQKADEETKEKLSSGEVSINQAYKEIKQAEKKEQFDEKIKKQKQDIESGKIQMPDGVFEVIVIDPPWNYGREYDPDSSRVANPYPEMSQEELLKINLPSSKDSIIFLWTTHKFLWNAKELMDKWGFEYKANLVWDKEKIGMGAWLRMQCEFCLVGIKGKPVWNNTKWRDIIREPRREHSRKPEIFYTMIEEITVGRKLNFFSREEKEGWTSYGNDTEKF